MLVLQAADVTVSRPSTAVVPHHDAVSAPIVVSLHQQKFEQPA